jgi:hypothetical protein
MLSCVFILMSACREWYESVAVVPSYCGESESFQIDPGTQPAMRWNGGCRIGGAILEELPLDSTAGGRWVWEVHRRTVGYEAPFVIGHPSAESTLGAPHFELRSDRRYVVHVLRVVPENFAHTVLTTVEVAPR